MKISIDTSLVRCCSISSCKSKPPYYRHHKGCDNYIGRFDLRTRLRYKEYLDCTDVCDYHHMVIHYMYGPIIISSPPYDSRSALKLRAKLIAYCDEILAGKVKLRKPPKVFIAEWKRRRQIWKKRMKRPQH